MSRAVLVLFVLALSPQDVPSSERVRERARQILADRGYQTQLPSLPAASAEPAPSTKPVAREDSGSGALRGPTDLILSVVAWALLGTFGAAIAGVLVWWLARLWMTRPATRRGPRAGPQAVQSQATMPAELGFGIDDVLRTADSGDLAAAMHGLLLLAFQRLGVQATPADLALTSREVLRARRLPNPAHAALEILVAAVEHAYFGARAPGRADFERCLAAWRELEASPLMGAAA
jgi:hypothetical protein